MYKRLHAWDTPLENLLAFQVTEMTLSLVTHTAINKYYISLSNRNVSKISDSTLDSTVSCIGVPDASTRQASLLLPKASQTRL